jgi:coproporphyrinogen III oxidase-like Fe-S oxidoreductase
MAEHFQTELDELRAPGGLVEAGFVRVGEDGIEATSQGRMFIRNVAIVFDARLRAGAGDNQVFSRTV